MEIIFVVLVITLLIVPLRKLKKTKGKLPLRV